MDFRDIREDFYVAAYEVGTEQTPLPTWASHTNNPLHLDKFETDNTTTRHLTQLPATFSIQDVFSKQECWRFITLSEKLTYTSDAAVSLPRSVRHNQNMVWVIDEETHDLIWSRVKKHFKGLEDLYAGKKALGLNRRFRFYKYHEGDFFRPHTDGAWPGSGVINKKLVQDIYKDRYSKMTFLLLLNEDFEGGETAFYVHKDDASRPAKRTEDVKIEEVRVSEGAALCFAHGTHPLHALHGSRAVSKGIKYIIRTDVLFEL